MCQLYQKEVEMEENLASALFEGESFTSHAGKVTGTRLTVSPFATVCDTLSVALLAALNDPRIALLYLVHIYTFTLPLDHLLCDLVTPGAPPKLPFQEVGCLRLSAFVWHVFLGTLQSRP